MEERAGPRVTPTRTDLGRIGEEAAVGSYLQAGYRVVARNWRCPLGELDLVLSRGRAIVFCEVKTRRGTSFGLPFEAVTSRKQRKLRLLAEAFLRVGAANLGLADADVRFDVASVTLDHTGHLSLDVIEAAF